MKAMRIIAIWFALAATSLSFVLPVPFEEKIQRADAVARIVVVEIAKLKFTDQEDWTFTGLAKCRVVTDYTGAFKNTDFVYIPCDYTFDESPSPLEAGMDYIVFLDLLNHGRIAHPVSHDAAYEVSNGMLADPVSDMNDTQVSLKDFEACLLAQLKKKAEQVSAEQHATRPKPKPEGGGKPQPEAEGRSR